ncbi:MAG: apolipoprotein N-acyltransferase [Cyanobacteria bacterium P01_D01_bin.73]
MFQGRFRGLPPLAPWLVCGVGGVVGGLALEPVGWFPLAWVALVPLLWALRRSPSLTRWQVVRAGFAWGFGFHGVGLWWLTGLHPLTWLGLDWWTSVFVALGCWLFVSVWGALLVVAWAIATAAFWRWLDRRESSWTVALARIFWAATLWCAMETLANWMPLWWTALGLTQSPHNLLLLHWGQVSGPIAIAAILVLINGCIAEAVPLESSTKVKSWSKPWLVGAIALLLATEIAGLFAFTQPLGDTIDTAIEVGIIQGNIPNELKFGSDGWLLAIRGYSNGYQALSDQGVDLVIFPETAIPLIWQEPFRSRSNLYKAIRDRQTPALLGVFEPAQSQPSSSGRRSLTPDLTNSLLAVDGNVQPVGRYSKRHLVPLGEYIPFKEILGRFIQRLSPLQVTILPGKANQLLDTTLGRAIAGICYDSAFAENFRYQAAAGGEWIVTSSNNAHYRTAMFAQHHAQDVMRAIETDRWLASATNTGTSAIINPHGIDQWHSTANTYAAHADTLYRRTTQTLYVRWGNWLLIPLSGISLLLSGISFTSRSLQK